MHYFDKAKKYEGREQVMQQVIPILNCLWNDVLHFSAVHPKELKSALLEAGHKDIQMTFYQVNPELIDPKNSVVYLYVTNRKSEEDFSHFNPKDIQKFSSIPQGTKDYYKEILDKGGRPLLYHLVPHILYKGSIDTTNLPKIIV